MHRQLLQMRIRRKWLALARINEATPFIEMPRRVICFRHPQVHDFNFGGTCPIEYRVGKRRCHAMASSLRRYPQGHEMRVRWIVGIAEDRHESDGVALIQGQERASGR